MVDPVFKAPPPPPINETEVQPQIQSAETASQAVQSENNQQQPTEVPQEQNAEKHSGKQQVLNRLSEIKGHMVRYFWYTVGGLFLLGMFFGCAMSGSKSTPQQAPTQQKGLAAKVITNTDKKGKMPICGVARPTEACLFYVLNHSTQDRVAEDYFEQVAKAMERQLFKIRRDNVTYAKTLIKPAHFAEIIVPGY